MKRSFIVARVARLSTAPSLVLSMLLANTACAQAWSKRAVAPTDIRIVSRASELLGSPDRWSRGETGECPRSATTYTLYCAFDVASREVTGDFDGNSAAMQEARVTIGLIAPRDYPGRLDGYNTDTANTFADLQAFFRILENRLARRLTTVSLTDARSATSTPAHSRAEAIAVVSRARTALASPAVWNRADTRECPDTAKTVSIYCALELALKKETGASAHRDAILENARQVLETIAPNYEYYSHRLMDFNNDPSTTFFDVEKFFAVLRERVATAP